MQKIVFWEAVPQRVKHPVPGSSFPLPFEAQSFSHFMHLELYILYYISYVELIKYTIPHVNGENCMIVKIWIWEMLWNYLEEGWEYCGPWENKCLLWQPLNLISFMQTKQEGGIYRHPSV